MTPKVKRGYKVVRICTDGKGFKSAYDLGRTVLYAVDKPTHRPKDCGPLAVFTNRKSAEEFAMEDLGDLAYPGKLFRCEYTKSADRSLWVDVNYKRKVGYINIGYADSVTLLKEITL